MTLPALIVNQTKTKPTKPLFHFRGYLSLIFSITYSLTLTLASFPRLSISYLFHYLLTITNPNPTFIYLSFSYLHLLYHINISTLTPTLPSFTLLYTTLSFDSLPYSYLVHLPILYHSHSHSHSITYSLTFYTLQAPFTLSLSLFTYSFTLSFSIPIYFIFKLLSIPFNQLIHFYQNKH